jgi:hypothetical protein
VRSAIASSLFTLLATALAALGLAACGDSGPSPEEEVRQAAVRAAESDNSKAFCRTMVTDHYIQVIFGGDLDACVDSDDAVPKDPGQARATAVAIDREDEAEAEAVVTIIGGELDGTSGHVSMVEEEDHWKVDELGDDYARSLLLAAIEGADEGALSNRMMKACFSRQAKTLDDEKVRELAFAGYRSKKGEVTEALLPLAEKCPHALADYGAREFTKGLVKKGKSPAYVHCLQVEISFFLELTDIVPDLLKPKPGFASVAALEGIVEGAKKNCIELD